MKCDAYLYTNKGSRSNNEDSGDYYIGSNSSVFAVADGLGGHGYGEVASGLVINGILNALRDEKDITEEKLLKVMNDSNTQLISEQQKRPEYRDMRTTVVCAVAEYNIFRYFNVGDSRLYYFKNGCLYTQSVDHSVPQSAVALGEIKPSQIRFSDDRNKLIKVLGDADELRISRLPQPVTMEKGDAFLLCSDGFWEFVFEIEMEQDLVKSSSPKEWCSFMTRRLFRRVTEYNDNFTALCGFIL